ncbi:MAG TPA: hypothetical protein VGO09_03460 [Flavisolibacter sp.]|nr:hypothetical protein [Flavisolibacter sp.]
MVTIAITITFIEIIVLFAGALILGITIYFFIKTHRSLKQTFEQQHRLFPETSKKPSTRLPVNKEKELFVLHEQLRDINKKNTLSSPPIKPVEKKEEIIKKEYSKEHLTESLKSTIAQQQNLLSGFLKQVEELESEGKEKLALENEELQQEINNLEKKLEKKNIEITELKKEAATALKMAEKIEEVYTEFEQLQSKMISLEKQANRANHLAMELEDTRQSYEQVYKDLGRKGEKLEEALSQNQKMKQDLDITEDKLAEANLQRQQLQKKVQFLQDMNTDMQSMSDTNKKLQTELRRIGELESMLNMIAEERDHLLRKKN